MPKTILILGAGSEQLIAIRIAKELGLRVVAADGNARAPGLKTADLGVALDIRDVEAVSGLAAKEKADGIFTHAVEIPHVVAEAARRLGLPGIPPKTARRATHKLERAIRLRECGVPFPRFFPAESPAEAARSAAKLGFPAVVKPVDNAGARGVRKVETSAEAEAAYAWATRFSKERVVLIEEFVEGPEFSTESVIVGGKIVTTGFADRNYDKKEAFSPYFIEDGHTIPSTLSAAEQASVVAVAEQAIRALELDWGVAKGDIILTERGPLVFEMAARTSGGRFCADMVPLATGVQILKPLIQMAVGDTVEPGDLRPRHARGAAQRFLLPPPGRLRSVSGLDAARCAPGVYDVCVDDRVMPGFAIPQLEHHAARVGHIIASGRDRAEAVANAERAVGLVRFDVGSEEACDQ